MADQPPQLDDSSTQISLASTLSSILIVSVMMLCVTIAINQAVQQFARPLTAAYLPLLGFVVAFESACTTWWLRAVRLTVPWWTVRLAEAMLLFLGVQVLLGSVRGPHFAIKVDSFYGGIDSELLGLCVIIALIWVLSHQFTHCLLELRATEARPDREIMQTLDAARTAAHQSLISLLLLVGTPMVVSTAIVRLILRNSGYADLAVQTDLWHLLIYFVLGLILLNKTRLDLVRTGWIWEGIPIGRGVSTRWIAFGLVTILVVGLIALILPTQYSMGLLPTLSYLLNLVITVVQAIIFVVVSIFSFLLSLILPRQAQDTPSNQPPPRLPPPLPSQGSTTDFIQSLVFWIIFLLTIGYLLYHYLDVHPDLTGRFQRLRGLAWLRNVWHQLRTLLRGLNAQIAAVIEAQRARARQAAAARSPRAARWFGLRRLSPRQQVQFFYLAMVRRGQQHGIARQPAQTPYEYAQTLQNSLPEIDRDVTGLTDSFIEARYSRHDITTEKVGRVRQYWERIKRALRKK